jgi:hypothetical protein
VNGTIIAQGYPLWVAVLLVPTESDVVRALRDVESDDAEQAFALMLPGTEDVETDRVIGWTQSDDGESWLPITPSLPSTYFHPSLRREVAYGSHREGSMNAALHQCQATVDARRHRKAEIFKLAGLT